MMITIITFFMYMTVLQNIINKVRKCPVCLNSTILQTDLENKYGFIDCQSLSRWYRTETWILIINGVVTLISQKAEKCVNVLVCKKIAKDVRLSQRGKTMMAIMNGNKATSAKLIIPNLLIRWKVLVHAHVPFSSDQLKRIN